MKEMRKSDIDSRSEEIISMKKGRKRTKSLLEENEIDENQQKEKIVSMRKKYEEKMSEFDKYFGEVLDGIEQRETKKQKISASDIQKNIKAIKTLVAKTKKEFDKEMNGITDEMIDKMDEENKSIELDDNDDNDFYQDLIDELYDEKKEMKETNNENENNNNDENIENEEKQERLTRKRTNNSHAEYSEKRSISIDLDDK